MPRTAHAAVLRVIRACSKAGPCAAPWLREGGSVMDAACMLRESYR
jgi:hypothetical protein